MKLSDIDPKDIKVESSPAQTAAPATAASIKLSDLDPKDIKVESTPPPTSLGDQAMSALEGYGQGAVAGYLPQLQAKAQPLTDRVFNAVTGSNTPNAPWSQLTTNGPEYVAARDANIKRMAQEALANPKSYYGGQIAGVASAVPAMGSAAGAAGLGGDAASLVGRVGQAVGAGAIQGGLQNPGDIQGQVNSSQLSARAKNAGMGAALGGALQGGAEAANRIVKVVRGIPDFLTDFAENQGAAATGISKAEAKGAIKLDPTGQEGQKLKDLGRYALDNRLVRTGDTIEDIARRAGEAKIDVGQKIGGIYDKASSLVSDPENFMHLPDAQKTALNDTAFIPKEMGDDFLADFTKEAKGQPQGQQAINSAKKLVSNLAQNGDEMDIQDVQSFKSKLDDLIYKSDTAFKKSGQETPGIEAMKGMRNFLYERIGDRISALDSIFGSSLGGNLKDLNKQYGLVSAINSTARNRLSGDMGNNFLSLTDKIAVFEGAGIGSSLRHGEGLEGMIKGGITGAAVGLASKAARTYGRPIMANAANSAAGLIQNIPTGNLGPSLGGIGSAAINQPGLLGRLPIAIKGNQP